MKSETKLTLGLLFATLLAAPMVASAMAADTSTQNTPGGQSRLALRQRLMRLRSFWSACFLKEAEPATLTGTVLQHFRNRLVLSTSDQRLTVDLPLVWDNGTAIITLNQVYKEGYIQNGDPVTIKALKRTATNEKGVTIVVLVGYEIADLATGKHLTAVLPFNIITG